MRYKRKLIVLAIVIILLTAVEFAFPNNPNMMRFYTRFIFRPYQSLRNILFGYIPFSVGDLLYCFGVLLIIVLIMRWVYLLIRIRNRKEQLASSFIHTLIAMGIFYILFIIGWGANYYKPSLSKYWEIADTTIRNDSMLIDFDKELVNRLNVYAPHYHNYSFKQVNKLSEQYYKKYTDCNSKLSGLKVKPSVFNYLMFHLGIQGYYNPFTGEAQVNKFQPAFMMPFVICHEMAHQAGVANEGDANLMAYVIGTSCSDTSFKYSSCLNLWLYVQSRLRFKDSVVARNIKLQLNGLTRAHLDTLRTIRQKYLGVLSEYSSRLYDEYLRLHSQKGGIHSYGNVIATAWLWEQKRQFQQDTIIHIP